MPVLAPTRDQPFYTVIPTLFSRLLRSRWGYGGAHSRLNPPGPHGGGDKIASEDNANEKHVKTCQNQKIQIAKH